MSQGYDNFGALIQRVNYPDRFGLGQQFADDYTRALDEYEARVRKEKSDRVKARRALSRGKGYRPSRPA